MLLIVLHHLRPKKKVCLNVENINANFCFSYLAIILVVEEVLTPIDRMHRLTSRAENCPFEQSKPIDG